MTTRSWRGVAAVAGLLGLLALVAFAAAGHAPGGGSSRPSASTPSLLKDYLATIALLMIPAGAFLIFYAAFLKRVYKDVPLMKSSGLPVPRCAEAVRVLTVFVIFLAIAAASGATGATAAAAGGEPAGGARRPRRQATAKGKPYDPHFQWLPMLVLGSDRGGIVGSMMLLTYRRRREEDDPEVMRVAVAQVLERDARRSRPRARSPQGGDRGLREDGAHARRQGLPARGVRGARRVPRADPRPSSARAAHSVRRLTRLFERARFSEHEIDSGMKEDAIDALSGLRAELLVAT